MIKNVNKMALVLIQSKLLVWDINVLEKECQAKDPRVNAMVISQIVSDLVFENVLPPVFLNPVTRHYEKLPDKHIEILAHVTPDNFRTVYSSLKHKASREAKLYADEVKFDDRILDPAVSKEIVGAVNEWIKESRPGFFQRILAFFRK